MAYAIVVRFEVRRECREQFLSSVRQNAAMSIASEKGCRRFDIVESEGGDILLYEIYRDAVAFAAHLATSHFKSFDAATSEFIISKEVTGGTLYEHAKLAAL